MTPHFPRAALRLLPFLALVALLTINFKLNAFGIAEDATFERWQLNGQARLLGGIYADVAGLDKGGAHMGKIWPLDGPPPDWADESTSDQTYALYAGLPHQTPVHFEQYRAQYGAHQVVYSWLARHLGMREVSALQFVPSILTALVLAWLAAKYRRHYGWPFATVFLLSLACAPLFLTMAKNLYWSPFLLLLPALMAAFAYEANDRRLKAMFLALLGGAMLLKCLSNYEYITSVTVLAASIFLVGPLFKDPERGQPQYGWAAAVFAVCIAAFAVAFLVHAGSRGDTLAEGVRTIYVEDIARRTYGDAGAFGGETGDSLRASPMDVLKIYLLDYPGKRTMILPGKAFLAMIAFCILGLVLRLALRRPNARRDAATLVVFLAVPVSWFVLAKGHSYTQTHINFVLWFIGFMPALLFVTGSTAKQAILELLGQLSRGSSGAPKA